MSLTYTSAADRVERQVLTTPGRLGMPDAMLVAASMVSLFAIALACAGTLHTLDSSEPVAERVPVVNLNTVADSESLEPALAIVFTNPSERRSAARGLFRFLTEERDKGRRLPNVGALARAHVTTGTPPASVAVLTSAQLAALKPSFTVRTRESYRSQVILFGLLTVLGFHIVAFVWRLRRIRGDLLLLVIAHCLTATGFVTLLARPDPLRDSFLVGRYSEGVLLGLAGMTAISLVNFRTVSFLELSYLPLFAAFSLSVVLLGLGSGPHGSPAKVNLGPVQPIEAIRLLLALFLAGYFARRWELLRGVRERAIRSVRVPDWINVPRAEDVVPVAAGVLVALFFFFLQKDLGPALFTCCVFLAVYAVARGRPGMAIAGLGVLVLGFWVGHALHVSQTLADRVSMWQSPWDNAVAGGDQIGHALWAMSTGGAAGTGLGLGDTRYLPAGHTDLILAAIGEQQGTIGLLLVTGLYGMLAWRGFRIGRLAHNDYGFFLATTLTLFLIVPVFIMAAGIVGAAPLTGVVTPFLSYGGSAMVTNFVALGVLASISADRRPRIDFTPFRAPIRWLGIVLVGAALGVIAIVVDVQIVHADDYVVRPHLGLQADGKRRFAYNPRVLDIVRALPRGTVYDRRGLPLATDQADVIAKSRDTYDKLGVSLAEACADLRTRCYPLGGRAFHVIGDARNRINWSAPNTSYVEREAEGTLRGFDDHASTVETRDVRNQPTVALKRDYRAVIPLLRHRDDPNDAAVIAFRSRPRDVRLTIDAGFQLRTAAIVASYAKRSGGKAAAVVLDADTGALLASASYPWPDTSPASSGHTSTLESDHDDSLLDRARYGLYPPGSTFKLVTASAALRQHEELQKATFTCSRLPDGRIGAKIPGWGRPIRDDVLDSHPHGTIDLREGLVRSCNAYFAQLAVKLGPEPLLAVATQLGISLTPAANARDRVNATLPLIGYGQADVVATPLRMARVAAAIAAGGVLPDMRWEDGRSGTASGMAAETRAPVFLDSESARLLGRYMRDAVLTGTGRSLRDHPARIAGKTGTAELSGKPSHSWFVGFAPYGPAPKRIAFAVIIENAGYGSANAAPAAGEIVSAAVEAGLLNEADVGPVRRKP